MINKAKAAKRVGRREIDTTLFNGLVIVPLDGQRIYASLYSSAPQESVWCLPSASSFRIPPLVANITLQPTICVESKINPMN